MTRRAPYPVIVVSLLVLLAGNASSSGDALWTISDGGDMRGSDVSRNFGKAVSPPVCGCPDLVYMEPFKAKGLGYVYSVEFTEAVQAVASGNSRYSPREIPSEWLAAAVEWRRYHASHPLGTAAPVSPMEIPNLPAKKDMEPFFGKGACSPALLYLASLEYRSRPGNQDVSIVFPRLVRAAAINLGTQVIAKSRMAGSYAKRAAAIGAKIAEAERMGAKECSTSELTRAKSELARARNDAAEFRTGVQETETDFSKAERLADALLANRRFAFRKGLKCYPEGGEIEARQYSR